MPRISGRNSPSAPYITNSTNAGLSSDLSLDREEALRVRPELRLERRIDALPAPPPPRPPAAPASRPAPPTPRAPPPSPAADPPPAAAGSEIIRCSICDLRELQDRQRRDDAVIVARRREVVLEPLQLAPVLRREELRDRRPLAPRRVAVAERRLEEHQHRVAAELLLVARVVLRDLAAGSSSVSCPVWNSSRGIPNDSPTATTIVAPTTAAATAPRRANRADAARPPPPRVHASAMCRIVKSFAAERGFSRRGRDYAAPELAYTAYRGSVIAPEKNRRPSRMDGSSLKIHKCSEPSGAWQTSLGGRFDLRAQR